MGKEKKRPMTGEASGGGILRDSAGNMVLAFADSFGSKTSLQAEALALYMGVKLCCMLDLSNITIECDSAVLIDVLNGHAATPWKLKTVLNKLDRYRHRFKNITVIAKLIE